MSEQLEALEMFTWCWDAYLSGRIEGCPFFSAFCGGILKVSPEEARRLHPDAEARLDAARRVFEAAEPEAQGPAIEAEEAEWDGAELWEGETLGDAALQVAESLAQRAQGWRGNLPGLPNFEDALLAVHTDAGDIAGGWLLGAWRMLDGDAFRQLSPKALAALSRAARYLSGDLEALPSAALFKLHKRQAPDEMVLLAGQAFPLEVTVSRGGRG